MNPPTGFVQQSPVVRETMADLTNSDPELEVMGKAGGPFAAAALMPEERPDVIILEVVEMPRMDGITLLRRQMAQHPIPVLMCSSSIGAQPETLHQAMAAGAVGVICKPVSV